MGFKSGRGCDQASGTFTDKKINGLIAAGRWVAGCAWWGIDELLLIGWLRRADHSHYSSPRNPFPSTAAAGQPCILHWSLQPAVTSCESGETGAAESRGRHALRSTLDSHASAEHASCRLQHFQGHAMENTRGEYTWHRKCVEDAGMLQFTDWVMNTM